MALKIFYSDRVEELAAKLKERMLAERRGADPFEFSQVVVPNTNIAKWLKMRVFSDTPALCAGVRFPFMESRLTELLSSNLPLGETVSLLSDNAYANAIMGALLASEHPEFDCFAPFRGYITDGDGAKPLDIGKQNVARKAWQLVSRLADLMDQYEVRRPEIVERWLKGLNATGKGKPAPGSAEAGEAALARALWGKGGAFPDDGGMLSLRQLYGRVKGGMPKGPAQRICFFGQSTLSILQVRILAWLAQTHDITFYHNNVCLEYWGDIETKAERIRMLGKAQAEKEDIDIAADNPLLRQWGVAGRETMRLLVTLEEENDGNIDFEWTCVADPARKRRDTLLGRLQEAICHRTGEAQAKPQDASLQIVGVPGIRREVEMVYNAIIGSVWKPKGSGERPWRECSFSDIAVLVPDMATYRPVIEAVFDARGDVPYGLVDTTASEDSKYLAGFLALADMARKGLTRETLFAVLDNPCVQTALGFSPDDVSVWRETTGEIGAFDGFETREGESLYNWDWALSRLRLACVADAVQGMPLAAVGDASRLRLSEIVELLYRRVKETFGAPKGAGEWARAFRWLMGDFLAVPEEGALEGTVRRQIILTLDGLAEICGERALVGYEFVVAAVEHFVGGISCRKGGYLTHGVTIAGLQPMRPVPFRQVFVLGLGEGGFPGRTGEGGQLDVRGAGWRLGDVTPPKMNRYLFLETLMAVRDRLVITYPNRDIEKDAELFPSGLVRELEEFAGRLVEGGKFKEFEKYPLLEHGERSRSDAKSPVCDIAWSPTDPDAGILPTYSRWARAVAAEQVLGSVVRGRRRAVKSAPGGDVDKARREVSAHELAEFLKSPFSALMRYRFGVGMEGYRDNELGIDSPLGIDDGPTRWALEAAWLEGNGDLEGPFREMQLSGRAPMGVLGDFAKGRFSEGLAQGGDALLAFAESFGGGEKGVCTDRQNLPVTIRRADGIAIDVRYTSATPKWNENGGNVSALVPGNLKNNNGLPPDRTLDAFIGFLMHAANDGNRSTYTLRVGVIDIGNAAAACWRWKVTPVKARSYLDGLALRYLSYLELPKDNDTYVDFTYRRLAKALAETRRDDGAIDWNGVLHALTKEEPGFGGSGFNKALVVEQSIEKYRRNPTVEELQEIYDAIYALPLAGEMEGSAE